MYIQFFPSRRLNTMQHALSDPGFRERHSAGLKIAAPPFSVNLDNAKRLSTHRQRAWCHLPLTTVRLDSGWHGLLYCSKTLIMYLKDFFFSWRCFKGEGRWHSAEIFLLVVNFQGTNNTLADTKANSDLCQLPREGMQAVRKDGKERRWESAVDSSLSHPQQTGSPISDHCVRERPGTSPAAAFNTLTWSHLALNSNPRMSI